MTETTLSIDESIQLMEAIKACIELTKLEGEVPIHLESLSNKLTRFVLQIPLNRSLDEWQRANIITLSFDPEAGIEL